MRVTRFPKKAAHFSKLRNKLDLLSDDWEGKILENINLHLNILAKGVFLDQVKKSKRHDDVMGQ